MGKQMMKKRSKIDIAMLVISTVLITWLSVMEQIRNTFIETGEAFISKKTMFWLDICSIIISALLTIFSGVKVGKTEKAIKRSREAKNDEMDIKAYVDYKDDEMNKTQHPDTTQINSFSFDNKTINNFTINLNSTDLSQTIDALNDSPRINELYDQRLNASLSRLNKSYNGNLTFSNHSMERQGFLAPRIVENHPHSFPSDIPEVSDVTFSSSRTNTLSNIINSINPNINEEVYSESYSEDKEDELLTNDERRSSK